MRQSNEKSLVIVQLARFGDIIQTSPLLQNLKKQDFAISSISVVVDTRSAAAASLLPEVDRIIPLDINQAANLLNGDATQTYWKLRGWIAENIPSTTFDRLILLNDDPLAGAVSSLLNAREKSGPVPGFSMLRPHRYLHAALRDRALNPLHLSEVWAAYGPRLWPLPTPHVYRKNTGITFAHLSTESSLDPWKNKYFAVNIGAGAEVRMLRAARLAALTHFLLDRGPCFVGFLGVEKDKTLAESILTQLPETVRNRVFNLVGKTSLPELPALLDSADVLISSDTGTLQLAAACDVKTIGLFFGGAKPNETGCFAEGSVALMETSTREINPDEKFDPAQIAGLAWDLAETKNIDHWNEDFYAYGIHMLVAGSAPVAPEYVAVKRQQTDSEVSWGRCSFIARSLLWNHVEYATGNDDHGSRSERPGGPSALHRGSLIEGLLTTSEIQDVEPIHSSREFHWLQGLLKAIPEGIPLLRSMMLNGAQENFRSAE